MKKKMPIGVKLLIAFVIAVFLGSTLAGANIVIQYQKQINEERNAIEEAAGNNNEKEENAVVTKPASTSPATIRDVSTIVDNAMPFIVSIRSEVVQTGRDIFGRRTEQVSVGAGSGIIIGQSRKELRHPSRALLTT